MKKFLALALALVMICALSVTCFAAIGRDGSGSETETVTAIYAVGVTPDVYGVNVEFGSMEFTYTTANLGTWDPSTHTYSNVVEAEWTCEENENKVTVTNHSNVDITVRVAYADNTQDEVEGVTGSFDRSTFDLDAGVVGKKAEADSDTVYLTLSGAITEGSTNLGTVTVTISKKAS